MTKRHSYVRANVYHILSTSARMTVFSETELVEEWCFVSEQIPDQTRSQ